MKQQYRHTAPYRGKDPSFVHEELNEYEADNVINDAKVRGVICIRCGGGGGSYHYEEGGGSGYLPCFNCGDSGVTGYYDFIDDSN